MQQRSGYRDCSFPAFATRPPRFNVSWVMPSRLLPAATVFSVLAFFAPEEAAAADLPDNVALCDNAPDGRMVELSDMRAAALNTIVLECVDVVVGAKTLEEGGVHTGVLVVFGAGGT